MKVLYIHIIAFAITIIFSLLIKGKVTEIMFITILYSSFILISSYFIKKFEDEKKILDEKLRKAEDNKKDFELLLNTSYNELVNLYSIFTSNSINDHGVFFTTNEIQPSILDVSKHLANFQNDNLLNYKNRIDIDNYKKEIRITIDMFSKIIKRREESSKHYNPNIKKTNLSSLNNDFNFQYLSNEINSFILQLKKTIDLYCFI